MDSLENTAFCPYCAATVIIPHNEKFEFGRPIQCKNCSKKFNIFGIYEKIYKNIEIGKRIANESTNLIYSDYDIDGSSEYNVSKLKDYMLSNFGKKSLENIILKSLVYGTYILHRIETTNGISFKPIDLSEYEIITEFGTKGGHALHELIKEVKNFQTDVTIPRKDIAILYVNSNASNSEIGFSLYGMWFRIWSILNIAPTSISYSKSFGKSFESKKLTEIHEYYKNQMLNTTSIIKMTNGASERETLAWRIESEIFPSIIGKSAPKFSDVKDLDLDYPSMKFTKDSK